MGLVVLDAGLTILLLNLMMLRDEMLDGECAVSNRHLIMVFTVVLSHRWIGIYRDRRPVRCATVAAMDANVRRVISIGSEAPFA